MHPTNASIVWFRQDLRLADNPALQAAVDRGGPVVPLYIWSPEDEGPWSPGAAGRWWLHHAIVALDADLRKLGSRLIIRVGRTVGTLASLFREVKADAVFWNRRYEPAAMQIEAEVESTARKHSVATAPTAFEPNAFRNSPSGPIASAVQRRPCVMFTTNPALWSTRSAARSSCSAAVGSMDSG